MTPEERAELRRKCEAAAAAVGSGRWRRGSDEEFRESLVVVDGNPSPCVAEAAAWLWRQWNSPPTPERAGAVLDHIAAACPEVVLLLLDALDAAEHELARRETDQRDDCIGAREDRAAREAAEVERLRASPGLDREALGRLAYVARHAWDPHSSSDWPDRLEARDREAWCGAADAVARAVLAQHRAGWIPCPSCYASFGEEIARCPTCRGVGSIPDFPASEVQP